MHPYRLPQWVQLQVKPEGHLSPRYVFRLKVDDDWVATVNRRLYRKRMVDFNSLLRLAEQSFGASDELVLYIHAHPPGQPPDYQFSRFLVKWRKARAAWEARGHPLDKPTTRVVEHDHDLDPADYGMTLGGAT